MCKEIVKCMCCDIECTIRRMMHEVEIKGKKTPVLSECYYCMVCQEAYMTDAQMDSLRTMIPVEVEE